jgi:phosphoribosyl 1,2-cyclic phosphate phosphodiesterase
VTAELEITVLGCGSSGGVPRADGNWGACDPTDPRNARSRCSLLVRRKAGREGEPWTTVVVDTSPDFRLQAAAAGIERVDAVLYTHDHADQTHGIDDLRVFAGRMRRRVPCFMDEADHEVLTRRFGYVFKGAMDYPAICDAHRIPPHGTLWEVEGPSGPVPVLSFPQVHGPIESVGFRFGGVAYSADVSDLPEAAMAALEGLDLWIVDALRWTPHPTHADVAKTLSWIAELKPKHAVLTNMHVDLDYAALARQLPDGVEPAFDGWRATFAIDAAS